MRFYLFIKNRCRNSMPYTNSLKLGKTSLASLSRSSMTIVMYLLSFSSPQNAIWNIDPINNNTPHREDAKYTAKEEFSTTTIIDLFKIPTMEVSLIA